MMRGITTVASLVSIVAFPWPLSVGLVLIAACFEPLVPLAAGIFADGLYYVPQGGSFPYLATVSGAIVTLVAYAVRSRLKTGSI